MHRAGILLAALTGVNALGCGSGQSVAKPSPSSYTANLGAADRAPAKDENFPESAREQWTRKIGRGAVGGLVIESRFVAAQDVRRFLVLLDRNTGERMWRKRLKGPGITRPIILNELILSATGGREGRVYAFDVSSGDRRWNRKLPFLRGPISASGDRVFAASERGVVFGLSLENGKVDWTRRTNSPVRSGVTLTERGVFFATEDSLLIADPEDGSNVIAAGTPGGIIQPPALLDSTLVLTSPDGVITAYVTSDLREIWRVETSDPIFGSAAIARDTVFAVTLTGALWKVPLANPDGATRVELGRTIRATPSPLRVGVLLGTTAGRVFWLVDDPDSPRWEVSLDGPILTQPQLSDGQIVIADGRGKIHSWK